MLSKMRQLSAARLRSAGGISGPDRACSSPPTSGFLGALSETRGSLRQPAAAAPAPPPATLPRRSRSFAHGGHKHGPPRRRRSRLRKARWWGRARHPWPPNAGRNTVSGRQPPCSVTWPAAWAGVAGWTEFRCNINATSREIRKAFQSSLSVFESEGREFESLRARQ
jgi:hypothetical protein